MTTLREYMAKVNDLLPPALTGSGADLVAILADMRQPPQAGPAPARQQEAYSQP